MRWVTEQEYRQSGAESTGVTINVAFLMEIKTDFGFRDLLNQTYHQLQAANRQGQPITERQAADLLSDLRDELETYFALEEFYGYFNDAATTNPRIEKQACQRRSEHEKLYLELSDLVESAHRILYREKKSHGSLESLADCFESFCQNLAEHEQAEMDLMMQLCNEDIGVGD